MAFHDDLLEQARHLIHKERRKPKRASLKRGVSAAYYALFHLLVDDGAQMLVSGVGQSALRSVVKRAYAHSSMKAACKAYSQRALPEQIRRLTAGSVSSELETVTTAFVELQQARHEADYAPECPMVRSDAKLCLRLAERAFENWARVCKSQEARVFLTSLLLWGRWKA